LGRRCGMRARDIVAGRGAGALGSFACARALGALNASSFA